MIPSDSLTGYGNCDRLFSGADSARGPGWGSQPRYQSRCRGRRCRGRRPERPGSRTRGSQAGHPGPAPGTQTDPSHITGLVRMSGPGPGHPGRPAGRSRSRWPGPRPRLRPRRLGLHDHNRLPRPGGGLGLEPGPAAGPSPAVTGPCQAAAAAGPGRTPQCRPLRFTPDPLSHIPPHPPQPPSLEPSPTPLARVTIISGRGTGAALRACRPVFQVDHHQPEPRRSFVSEAAIAGTP